jgi:small-conductance mechanosensitive channel
VVSSFFEFSPAASPGMLRKMPVPRAAITPITATQGPQLAGGKERGGPATSFPARLASMSPAVSQVSRTTKTRLRILRRLIILAVGLVVAAIVLAQFTELKRLATGILASTAVIGLIVGFAAQKTIGNVIAGVLIAIAKPIRIGDRVTFEETEGRVTDITLNYTFLDPGDGSSYVIPNQLLVEGIVHNHSTEDTQA